MTTTVLFHDDFVGPAGPISSRPGWDAKHYSSKSSLADWNGWGNVSLDGNGHLIITATPEANGRWLTAELAGTIALTGPRFTVVRAKCAPGVGAWAAPIWEEEFPYGGVDNVGDVEIDESEILGKTHTTDHFTVHNWAKSPEVEKGMAFDTGKNLSTAYHLYAALTLPEWVIGFFDGKPVGMVSKDDVGVADFTAFKTCLMTDLDMGSWGGTPADGLGPQKMILDDVLVLGLS